MAFSKESRRLKIKRRVRKNIFGTQEKPRLSVFRSNSGIYAQIIDDEKGVTLASASVSDLQGVKGTKSEIAKLVGIKIAEKAKDKAITTVVFDRNGYLYHGRIKSLADGAREGGLQF
jgi:large subunit ribosomal protein L18